ncbi:hypothetical protein SFRURICE_001834 [Spodoptera frugiperda]|uniref:SFRICE_019797 n=1 Tax=Spodoptera frugiperda TaxID=7108 RepID=A0A2H1WT42_SPOFR|nr:hypothetical protein SFRURICE_001834 [Spodoptera frugiperda]
MDDDIFPVLCPSNAKKTYSKPFKKLLKTPSVTEDVAEPPKPPTKPCDPGEPLTTKVAVEYLLSGKLKTEVCRYCLKISPALSDPDQIMHIAGTGVLYKVSLRQMIASFYPFKANENDKYPEKICQKCVDRALNAYLFTQQCEQAERALKNCFDDIDEKLSKLDPIDRPKKRGRQKLNPNYNVLYVEHAKVMDYAEPAHHIINIETESLSKEPNWNEFECKRCWQVLPDMESLLNHDKTHPKSMWYHCRLCGKSFIKQTQLKKHFNLIHVKGQEDSPQVDKNFRCQECGNVTEDYAQHLQHVEKHKFKTVMRHLVERKTDQLCMVCLKKSTDLVNLDKEVSIHGSCPELVGDKSLYTVLSSTLPDMNYLHNFIGTKICEKCLNHAITSYVFVKQFLFTRERLDLCVTLMLRDLSKIEPSANVFVQVSPPPIMAPIEDFDEIIDESEFVDESKLKIDVLEDEFRLKTSSESETEPEHEIMPETNEETKDVVNDIAVNIPIVPIDNLARTATKTYMKKKLVNGIQNQSTKYSVDVCSEFLTFNKKKKVKKVPVKYTCPLCNKHFISDYFLKRHIVKHVNKKVECKICGNVYKSRFLLFEHRKVAHLVPESFYMTCKVCGRNYTDIDKLQDHEQTHRIKPCELCNKVFTTQAHYETHIQRHSVKLKLLNKNRTLTCSFCEKECPNDNQLSLHVNKIHLQIKPYSCDMCDRQFYTENNMKCHKKVHSMPSKEVCEFCNKTLKSRKQLVVHVRKHIGVKPFGCQICGQYFYSAFKVRKHMRLSHGGIFCCRICKSIFPTKYELKAHVNRDHNII